MDEREWLRRWVYTKGYPGVGISKQLREAMRELKHETHPRWWACAMDAMDVIKAGGIVGLFGDFGRGKSLMGAYLALEYWRHLPMPAVREAPPKPQMLFATELMRRVQASWKNAAEGSEKALLSKLHGCPLLVIDEVHERGDSEWASHMLIGIVKQRESRKNPTMLITNETPEQYAKGVWGSVMDRIIACKGDFSCEWENLRRQAGAKGTT